IDEQYVARRNVKHLPDKIARLKDRLDKFSADHATASGHANDPITIKGNEYGRDEASVVLGAQLDRLPRGVTQDQRILLGTYRGLRFGLVLSRDLPPDVYLDGTAIRYERLLHGNSGPRAILNALERICKGYDTEVGRLKQELSVAEGQLVDYQTRIGQPFS